jgi:hypothetical protein
MYKTRIGTNLENLVSAARLVAKALLATPRTTILAGSKIGLSFFGLALRSDIKKSLVHNFVKKKKPGTILMTGFAGRWSSFL